AFGCPVWVPRKGLRRLKPELRAHARGYGTGDRLPGGLRAVGIGVLCPDEFAVLLPELKAASVADGLIRQGKGPLTFVPVWHLADDPRDVPKIKRGLRKSYAKLAKQRWDHLL